MLTKSTLGEANGASLFCEQAGAGPAVLLIRGFPLDTRMWDDQANMEAPEQAAQSLLEFLEMSTM